MVVDDVLNDGNAAPMAFAYEVAVLVTPSRARLNTKMVRVAIAPADGAREFGHRQQLDGVHAEIDKVIEKGDGVAQIAGRRFAESERSDMQLVDEKIGDARRNRHTGSELRRPEFLG